MLIRAINKLRLLTLTAMVLVISQTLLVSLEFLPQGIIQIILDSPIIAGFGFLPVLMLQIRSAKQTIPYSYTDDFTNTAYDGTADNVMTETLNIDMFGWVGKVDYTIINHIPVNNNVVMGGMVVINNEGNEIQPVQVGENWTMTDILDEYGGTSNAQAALVTSRPWIEVFQGAMSGDTIHKHTVHVAEFVEPGDTINVQVAAKDIAAADTAGTWTIRVTLWFTIAALQRAGSAPRGMNGERPPYLIFFGTIGSTDGFVTKTWIPWSDARVYGIYGAYYGLTLDETSFISFGDKLIRTDDELLTPDTTTEFIQQNVRRSDHFFVGNETGQETDTTDNPEGQGLGITKFKKDPMFMKKSDPYYFQSNNDTGNDNWFFLSMSYLPDYQNDADFTVSFNMDETAEDVLYWRVPYDMYVQDIQTDVNWTVTAAQTGVTDGMLTLVGIKPGDLPIATSSVDGFFGDFGSTTAQSLVKSAGALDTIPITAPPGDGLTYTNSYSLEERSEVNDYYPKGSHIGVHSNGITTVTDMTVTMQINAINTRKWGKRDVLAYFHKSAHVLNMNTMEVGY